jgi:hypothetical protein
MVLCLAFFCIMWLARDHGSTVFVDMTPAVCARIHDNRGLIIGIGGGGIGHFYFCVWLFGYNSTKQKKHKNN